MSRTPEARVTLLLQRARENKESALGELMELVHDELRRIAGAQMKDERVGHTLEPTALVHEAFVRLAGRPEIDWQGRAHFLGVAAQAMRHILVDHARAKGTKKRGGGRARITIQEELLRLAEHGAEDDGLDLLDLDEKLETLRQAHERRARVVELRFFGGLTFEESAHVLDVSAKTVEADWYFARAWLRREMRAGNG